MKSGRAPYENELIVEAHEQYVNERAEVWPMDKPIVVWGTKAGSSNN